MFCTATRHNVEGYMSGRGTLALYMQINGARQTKLSENVRISCLNDVLVPKARVISKQMKLLTNLNSFLIFSCIAKNLQPIHGCLKFNYLRKFPT